MGGTEDIDMNNEEKLKKGAAFHKALAETHKAMAAEHLAHGEFCSAKADGMEDGDPHKGYFGKAASFHKSLAANHTAIAALHAAHAEPDGDEEKVAAAKAAGAPTPAPAVVVAPAEPGVAIPEAGSVESMVKETTTGLVKSALEMLKSDDTVQAEIRKMVLAGVQSALGDKMVPDSIHAILPTNPNGPRLVPRPGGAEIPTAGVDPQLRKFVEA